MLSVLAGDDRNKVKGRMSHCERGLRRSVKGVGEKLAGVLSTHYKHSFSRAISGRPDIWKELGANKLVLRHLKELQDEGV